MSNNRTFLSNNRYDNPNVKGRKDNPFERSEDFMPDLKRKREFDDGPAPSRKKQFSDGQNQKFSANTRLKQYRDRLNKFDGGVKVHEVLYKRPSPEVNVNRTNTVVTKVTTSIRQNTQIPRYKNSSSVQDRLKRIRERRPLQNSREEPTERGPFQSSREEPRERGPLQNREEPRERGSFQSSREECRERGLFQNSREEPRERGLFQSRREELRERRPFQSSREELRERGSLQNSGEAHRERGLFQNSGEGPRERGSLQNSREGSRERGPLQNSREEPRERNQWYKASNFVNDTPETSFQEHTNKPQNEVGMLFAKPSKANLPDSPVDFTRKCINYLKTTTINPENMFETAGLFKNYETFSPPKEDSDYNSNENDNFESQPFPKPAEHYTPPNNNTVNCYYTSQERRSSENELKDSDVEMEWSPFDEKVILTNIQNLRSTMTMNTTPSTSFQKTVADNSSELPYSSSVLRNLYIVVDTNIFVAYLKVVQQLMGIKINGVVSPIVLIPWIVIQELDYMKDGRSGRLLQKQAQTAIKFINNCLLTKTDELKGQSIDDALKQKMTSNNADDDILNCCLQVVERNNRVILLSNDINLRNKALMNHVPAYGHNEILAVLDPFYESLKESTEKEESNDSLEETKKCISHLISLIIVEEMKEAYASVWNKMALMAKPPWPIEGCLERLLKYWQAVFSYSLQKQAKQCIEEFKEFLANENNITSDNINSSIFLDHCLKLCFYLKSAYKSQREGLNECIEKIQQIKDTL